MIKVSILLPVYNGAERISRAIQSVLSQDYSAWDLLILDDGSADDTKKVVAKFAADPRIRYLRNEINLGIQKTLNRGLQAASGEYIARIDDDDAWIDADKLAKQVEFLNTHLDYALVGTGALVVAENGKNLFRFLNPDTDAAIRCQLLYRNCFTHSSVLFRKSAAMQQGGYSEAAEVLHLEDYDLWLKLGLAAKFANLNFHAVAFMLRASAISAQNKRRQFLRQFRLIKKYRGEYPGYAAARIKSWLRLALYTLFGELIPMRVRYFVMRLYKRG